MACNTYLEEKNIKLHDLFSDQLTILLAVGSIGLIIGLLFIPPQMFFTYRSTVSGGLCLWE